MLDYNARSALTPSCLRWFDMTPTELMSLAAMQVRPFPFEQFDRRRDEDTYQGLGLADVGDLEDDVLRQWHPVCNDEYVHQLDAQRRADNTPRALIEAVRGAARVHTDHDIEFLEPPASCPWRIPVPGRCDQMFITAMNGRRRASAERSQFHSKDARLRTGRALRPLGGYLEPAAPPGTRGAALNEISIWQLVGTALAVHSPE
jgi:hypothetical protein